MADIEKFFKSKKGTAEEAEEKKEESKKSSANKMIRVILLSLGTLVFLGSAGASIFFYSKYRMALKNTIAEPKSETQIISEKIGQIFDLPQEEPTLATITDTEKLKGQAFFQNAQNGDKVLLYSKAQKAILWRPTVSKIIEVSSLSSQKEKPNETQSQPGNSVSNTDENQEKIEETKNDNPQNQTARVTVLNGTTLKGLAKSLGNRIASVSGADVVSTGNAQKSDYVRTIIVDLTGKNQSISEKIAVELSGKVVDLPEGEEKPDADILVIGGTE
jgi:hypothetical protein